MDDDDLLLNVIGSMLKRLGYNVESAPEGKHLDP